MEEALGLQEHASSKEKPVYEIYALYTKRSMNPSLACVRSTMEGLLTVEVSF